ncbi:hypothetical protein ACTXOR_04200 [Arthrobacter rhombi]|uniref:hypothetical protein n=1 Tax=Arthrobacter rhombi TaxID=71253 RepID=UPI003FCEFCBA
MNKKKLVTVLVAVLACVLVIAGVAWFQSRPGSQVTAALDEGVTATAETPTGTSLQIDAVKDTDALQNSLPKELHILAAGNFDLRGEFPHEGMEATFDVGEADPKSNYVVGYLDEASGKWEFTTTEVSENGQLTATLPHSSIWSVVTSTAQETRAASQGPDAPARKAKSADCSKGSKVPAWAVHLQSKANSELMTWCSQSDDSGNLVLRVVNNDTFPLPLKLTVEPDQVSIQDDGKTAEDPYVRLKDGALVLPALSGVDLTFNEASIGKKLRTGQDQLRLVSLDDNQVRGFSGVDAAIDLIGVEAWEVRFISPTTRAGLAAMLVDTVACKQWDVEKCVPDYTEAAITNFDPDFLKTMSAGSWATGLSEKYLNPGGTSAPKHLAEQLKKATPEQASLLRAIGFGTASAQMFKQSHSEWGKGGKNIDLSIQLPYVDYMSNSANWKDQEDPRGYVSFEVRKDWKVKEIPLKEATGYGFMDGEGSILSISNKDGLEIAQFTTGMTNLGLENLMPRDPQTGEPLEMRTVDHTALPHLDGKRGSSEATEYGAHAFEAYKLLKPGTEQIVDVAASIINGNESLPFWQFSQNSYGVFTTPALAKNGLTPSEQALDSFDRDPLFFELRRMMTSLRFTDKAEPGAKSRSGDEATPQAENGVCEGSRFSYEGEMAAADCAEAKAFVEKITVDENLVSKGWVSRQDEGGCMAEPGVTYEGMDGMTCRMPGGRTFIIHVK